MAKISGRGSIPLYLNTPGAEIEPIEHVEDQSLVVFDYTGAIDVSEFWSEQMTNTDADAATNVTVEVGSNVPSFFINVITFGIANAYTVTVNADLVNVQRASLLQKNRRKLTKEDLLGNPAESMTGATVVKNDDHLAIYR